MVCIDAQGQPSRRKRGRGVGSAKWKESWHEIQEGGRSCAACHQVNRSPGTEQSGLQPLCPSVVAGAWQQEGGGGGGTKRAFLYSLSSAVCQPGALQPVCAGVSRSKTEP